MTTICHYEPNGAFQSSVILDTQGGLSLGTSAYCPPKAEDCKSSVGLSCLTKGDAGKGGFELPQLARAWIELNRDFWQKNFVSSLKRFWGV